MPYYNEELKEYRGFDAWIIKRKAIKSFNESISIVNTLTTEEIDASVKKYQNNIKTVYTQVQSNLDKINTHLLRILYTIISSWPTSSPSWGNEYCTFQSFRLKYSHQYVELEEITKDMEDVEWFVFLPLYMQDKKYINTIPDGTNNYIFSNEHGNVEVSNVLDKWKYIDMVFWKELRYPTTIIQQNKLLYSQYWHYTLYAWLIGRSYSVYNKEDRYSMTASFNNRTLQWINVQFNKNEQKLQSLSSRCVNLVKRVQENAPDYVLRNACADFLENQTSESLFYIS